MTDDVAGVAADAFLGGALSIRQPRRGYRAGIDPVLLAAMCPDDAGRVLDCGAGVGTVGLCVARRLAGVRVVMVEREPEMAALARENMVRNALAERLQVLEADLTAPLSRHQELTALSGTFDQVLANPPYFIDVHGTRSVDGLKDAANAMPAGSLDDWARFMAAMARPGGMATVIHRAEALAELLEVMSKRFGGLMVLPVQPRSNEAANRVIVRGVKGSRAPLRLLPALVVHGDDGHGYRPEVEAVLRGPVGLSFLESGK